MGDGDEAGAVGAVVVAGEADEVDVADEAGVVLADCEKGKVITMLQGSLSLSGSDAFADIIYIWVIQRW